MKNFFHLTGRSLYGFQQHNRFVFQDGGQTESFALAGIEAGQEKQLSPENGKEALVAQYKQAKETIDSQAAQYKKKFEGKEDGDKAQAAIEKARGDAQEKLAASYNQMVGQLEKNSETTANEQVNAIISYRKEKAEGKYNDALIYETVPGKAGFTWSPKGKVGADKSNEWNHLGEGDFKVALTAMIKAVYVAEGPKAADDLVNKMKHQKLGFDEMQADPEYAFGQGTYHDPPLIQFNPDMDNDENGNTRKLTGLVFGYAHAARNRLENEDAREAYFSYLASSGKKAGAAPRSMDPDDILTPDQWLAQSGNEKYLGAAKKLDEEKLNEERTAQVDDYLGKLSNTKQRGELKGLLLGRLQGESDPKKWNQIMRETSASAFGMTLDVYSKTEWSDLDKSHRSSIDDFVKKAQANMGKYVLEEGQNHDGKSAGYVAGLLMRAEEKFKDDPAMLAKYKEQLKAITDSEDLKKKMGDNLANSEYFSKRVGEVEDNYSAKKDATEKLSKANDALFDIVKQELPSPDKFVAAAKEEKDEKYKKIGEKYRNQERYADDMIAKIPADKVKERNYIRSILIAAVGRETDPDKIKALGEAALKDKAGLNLDPDKLGSVDYEKNLKAFVDAHTDFTENGKKMDDQSKSLAAGLLYAAEVKYKDEPNKDKILAAYKKYLKGKMDTLGKDSDNQEDIEKLKLKQSLLEDTIDKGTRDKILADIDKLQTKLYNKSWNAMAWPDTFKEDFSDNEQLITDNKNFLDKHGTREKVGTFQPANREIDAILDEFKKDHADAYSKNEETIKGKIVEFHKRMASRNTDPEKGEVIKTPGERLKLLAELQGYLSNMADDGVEENQYIDATEKYTYTTKILEASTNINEAKKYVQGMAEGLGFDVKKDQKAIDALKAVNDAKPEDRAHVMAEQIAALYKDSPKHPENPFTKEDFDDYSQYILDKKTAPKTPGGGTGGGRVPSVGPSVAPGNGTPGGTKGPEIVSSVSIDISAAPVEIKIDHKKDRMEKPPQWLAGKRDDILKKYNQDARKNDLYVVRRGKDEYVAEVSPLIDWDGNTIVNYYNKPPEQGKKPDAGVKVASADSTEKPDPDKK